MYSRSARKFIEPNRATNAEIGPGYYEPDGAAASTALGAAVLPSTAPFSSITPRICYFDEVARRSGPAPGCYDTANVDPHHQPVRAVPFAASKAPRFADPPPKAPGPGAYSVDRDRARQLRSLRLSQLKPAGSGTTGARGGGSSDGPRIKWQRKYTPPSIPYGAQAVGYEETDDGTLLLRRTQSATDNSARLVGHKDLLRENAGTNFTKSQTRRQLWRETDTPGPGNYNVTAAWRKPDSFPSHEAPCVRFGDFVINEANRQAVPGPGSYDLPKDSTAYLKRGPILAKSTTHGITPTSDPFSIVPHPADTSPGPGAYDVTAATHPRKPLHLGAKPFNTSATRFNPASTPSTPTPTTATPGPGQYSVTTTLVRAPQSRATPRAAAFGGAAARFPSKPTAGAAAPGPAAYAPDASPRRQARARRPTVHQFAFARRDGAPHAAFGAHAARFGAPDSRAPPPGSYDVAAAFGKLTGRRRAARARSAPPPPVPVARAADDGEDEDNAVAHVRSATTGPGPCEYDPGRAVGSSGAAARAVFLSRAPRLVAPKHEWPAPNEYQAVAMGGRRTFNATLEGDHYTLGASVTTALARHALPRGEKGKRARAATADAVAAV